MDQLNNNLVSWSKTGLLAYSDKTAKESNLCITFIEMINGTNWRFHPPKKYTIHPHLYELQDSTPSTGDSNNSRNTQLGAGKLGSPSSTVGTNSGKANTHFFYDISGVYWNNNFNLPGDVLAVCDEIGNLTMMISGLSPQGPVTMDKLIMLFQDNVYKIHNHIVQLEDSASNKVNVERKKSKKEYPTAIADFFWLSSSKPIIASQYCAFDSAVNLYRNKVQQVPPFGMFHPPFMKYACLAVRVNGQVDFWYQFSNSKNHKKITLQLETVYDLNSKSLDWLQHVKITALAEPQSLMISCYSSLSKKLHFYKLHVNWNISASNNNQLNHPTLSIFNVFELDVDELDNEGNVVTFNGLHTNSRSTNDKEFSTELLISYNICGMNKSIVKRYKLSPYVVEANFLNSFTMNQSEAKSKTNLTTNRYNSQYISTMKFDSRISHMTSEILDGFVSIYFCDLTVKVFNTELWKPESDYFDRLENGEKNLKITSLLATGFAFPKIPCFDSLEWVRVTPSMAGVIVKQKNKQMPELFVMEATIDHDNAKEDLLHSTAIAFGFVACIHRQLTAEDLSVACKTHILKISQDDSERGKTFITNLMANIYTFFNITPDAPSDILDKMISSRPVQKAILFQLELGSESSFDNIYEMAKIVINLRNLFFAFNGVARNLQFAIEQIKSNSASPMPNGKLFQTAFTKQDLIHSLIPIARWMVKLITFLMQELVMLVNEKGKLKSSLVYGVFCAKIPRSLLLSIINEVKRISQLISKFPETFYPVLNESSHFLKMTLSECPISFEKLENFLIEINNKFQEVNEKNPLNLREPTMSVKAELLPEDSVIANFILSQAEATILYQIDPAAIYFADTDGLRISKDELFHEEILPMLQPLDKGLLVDSESLPKSFETSASFSKIDVDGISYDHFTQREIADTDLKRCCRCGCITRAGYVISSKKTIVPTSIRTKRWPTMYARICVCSGYLYELQSK